VTFAFFPLMVLNAYIVDKKPWMKWRRQVGGGVQTKFCLSCLLSPGVHIHSTMHSNEGTKHTDCAGDVPDVAA